MPTSVRKALQLRAGDSVVFEISGNRVTLRRATPLDMAFNQALAGTLSEWNSPADDKAFQDQQAPPGACAERRTRQPSGAAATLCSVQG